MNLYKIIFKHYSPKDSESGIICFLFANDDVEVYHWIASKPCVTGHSFFTDNWADYYTQKHCDGEGHAKYTKILENKGEINIDYMDYSDAYYGITNYGWELIQKNITEYDQLELTGLLYYAKN